MTLADKILELRTGRGLSQGDLAEKLEVSRQSVSKWETGQAVPELDKIIKLADLFGVSVDQLVREGEAPRPETPKAEVTERVIYMEKPRKGLTPVQTLGVVCGAAGGVMVLFGFLGTAVLLLLGVGLILLSLPLLLARRRPFVVTGWVVLAVSCLILNPYTSVSPWGLRGGVVYLYLYLTVPDMRYSTNLFAAAVGIVRGLLFLALVVYTVWLCWKKAKTGSRTRRKKWFEDEKAKRAPPPSAGALFFLRAGCSAPKWCPSGRGWRSSRGTGCSPRCPG